MNTKTLMRGSALFLAILGVSASFLPQEIVLLAGTPPVESSVLLVQIAGALYFGFAVLNWMAQGNLIGGIYSRPVAIGNLAHFTIGGLALVKSVLAGYRAPEVIAAAALYGIFAALFALVAFRHPGARVDA